MKKIKRIVIFLLTIVMAVVPITNTFASPLEGYKQVANLGGCNSNSKDGVIVCKTISESNLENYFDITLSVETTSKIEEVTKAQDLAVVLVMDISNTMNKELTSDESGDSNSRLDVAKSSVMDFISKFYNYSKESNAIRQIGLVTFNRDSNDAFGGLQDVNTVSESTLDEKVVGITAPTDVNIKWTNMEAGLKRANSLLATSKVKKQVYNLFDRWATYNLYRKWLQRIYSIKK